jgi:hypothetical protein
MLGRGSNGPDVVLFVGNEADSDLLPPPPGSNLLLSADAGRGRLNLPDRSCWRVELAVRVNRFSGSSCPFPVTHTGEHIAAYASCLTCAETRARIELPMGELSPSSSYLKAADSNPAPAVRPSKKFNNSMMLRESAEERTFRT